MESDILIYAYRLLGRKDYSEAELRKKFNSRFPDGAGFFDDVVYKLKDYGYIDDSKFFNNFVRSKILAGYGPNYIRFKLLEKGIIKSREIITELIDSQCDQVELAKQVMRKKNYSYSKYNFYQIKKKYFDFLTRRGFDTSLIIKVLQEELSDESNFS